MKKLKIRMLMMDTMAIILLASMFMMPLYPGYASNGNATGIIDDLTRPNEFNPDATTNTTSSGGNIPALVDKNRNNISSNPDFILIDNQSGIIVYGLPSYWNDTEKNCVSTFKCTSNFTTGWEDNTSLQISTTSNNNDTWSWIRSKEIGVNPDEQFELVTHMKLNEFATQSHIAFEGLNETSNEWYQIQQCPTGTNGPLEWHVFSCEVTIPDDTTKIRFGLNAGWSSQQNKEAVTFFDTISAIKLTNDDNQFLNLNLTEIKKLILSRISQQDPPLIKEYAKVNPTLWNVNINSSKAFTLAFAEPYDPTWEARIYKDGKKVDVAKSIPLYGAINAFQIDQSGDLEIKIRYSRQDWFEIGLMISIVTLSFCIFYLFYDWRRNKLTKKLEPQ
jgi:hypothetical protein